MVLPMIEVVCAVIIQKNRVLACQRPLEKNEGGKWEFPGGKIEVGEWPKEAVSREIEEELGVIVEVGKTLRAVIYGEIKLIPYRCDISKGDLVLNEHLAMKWVSGIEIPSLDWASADVPISQEVAALLLE